MGKSCRFQDKCGLTLVELIVGMGLMSLAAIALMFVLLQGHKASTSAYKRMGQKRDIATVAGHLQKFVPSGDVRFFAFMKKNPPLTPSFLGRFLIPQPGRCSDLSACNEDTSFLYIHYDKTTSPAVSVIDMLPGDRLIVDLKTETYGVAKFNDGEGFEVTESGGTSPKGKISIGANTLIAVMNPPIATLWRATGLPVLYESEACPTDKSKVCKRGVLPEERLPLSLPSPVPMPFPYENKLYSVPVEKFLMKQFTGTLGTEPTSVEAKDAVGIFPMRLFIANVRSVGRSLNWAPGDIEDPLKRGDFGINDCSIDGISKNIVCNGTSYLQTGKVSRVRMDEFFHVRMMSGALPTPLSADQERFELLTGTMPTLPSCQSATCKKLDVASPASITYLARSDETSNQIIEPNFSLIKQESLRKIRMHLQFFADADGMAAEEREFEILFY